MLIDPNAPPEPASEHGLSEGPDAVHCAEGLVIRDSASILTYLALKYDDSKRQAKLLACSLQPLIFVTHPTQLRPSKFAEKVTNFTAVLADCI